MYLHIVGWVELYGMYHVFPRFGLSNIVLALSVSVGEYVANICGHVRSTITEASNLNNTQSESKQWR